MLKRPQKQQKIVVSCIVEHDGQILLLRGSQVNDRASSRSMGYFSIPRFTVAFGREPERVLRDAFLDYFDQTLEEMSMIGTAQRLTDMGQTQEVEIIYRASVPKVTGRTGKFLFVKKSDADKYMFSGMYKKFILE
ncbi:hypothetical protein CL655_01030 [bacterium]|nr:hypothetical protein [bacterium]|tara:strand:- start:57 stop:461 length:405 start_codon:yes stop_codon:yes gene_type:complete